MTSLPPTGKPQTIDQLKARNTAMGYYFFTPDTLRYYKGRVYSNVWTLPDCWVFITSEQFECYHPQYRIDPRRYTARVMLEDGSVQEFAGSIFQQFKSKRECERWIESIIALRRG